MTPKESMKIGMFSLAAAALVVFALAYSPAAVGQQLYGLRQDDRPHGEDEVVLLNWLIGSGDPTDVGSLGVGGHGLFKCGSLAIKEPGKAYTLCWAYRSQELVEISLEDGVGTLVSTVASGDSLVQALASNPVDGKLWALLSPECPFIDGDCSDAPWYWPLATLDPDTGVVSQEGGVFLGYGGGALEFSPQGELYLLTRASLVRVNLHSFEEVLPYGLVFESERSELTVAGMLPASFFQTRGLAFQSTTRSLYTFFREGEEDGSIGPWKLGLIDIATADVTTLSTLQDFPTLEHNFEGLAFRETESLASCSEDGAVCLGEDERFHASVLLGEGKAEPVQLTRDSGAFWFFDEKNLEIFIKLVDGCAVNGNYWAFASGLTNIDLEIEIRDSETSDVWVWSHTGPHLFDSHADVQAFRCSE